MITVIYERRAWDIGKGKVFSIFHTEKDASVLNNKPRSADFWVWLDPQPERILVDVRAAIVRTELELSPDLDKPSGLGDTGVVDY